MPHPHKNRPRTGRRKVGSKKRKARRRTARKRGQVLKVPKNILKLPIRKQELDFSCGAASLMSVLNYWKVCNGKESSLYKDLEITAKYGVKPEKLAEVAIKHNLFAEIREQQTLDDLSVALRQGYTVILALQSWTEKNPVSWIDDWDDGHYVVLVGMDEENIFIMDPIIDTYGYIPKDEFMERWHDTNDEETPLYQLAIYIRPYMDYGHV